jgi:hypothetical protein
MPGAAADLQHAAARNDVQQIPEQLLLDTVHLTAERVFVITVAGRSDVRRLKMFIPAVFFSCNRCFNAAVLRGFPIPA